MQRLAIPVLPHIVNGLILTSVFSAGEPPQPLLRKTCFSSPAFSGNAFLFCASRSLAQMARDGQAPMVFARRNRNGVPHVAVGACLVVSLLSYCQVSSVPLVSYEARSSIETVLSLPGHRLKCTLLPSRDAGHFADLRTRQRDYLPYRTSRLRSTGGVDRHELYVDPVEQWTEDTRDFAGHPPRPSTCLLAFIPVFPSLPLACLLQLLLRPSARAPADCRTFFRSRASSRSVLGTR
jgi:hypothetical protein